MEAARCGGSGVKQLVATIIWRVAVTVVAIITVASMLSVPVTLGWIFYKEGAVSGGIATAVIIGAVPILAGIAMLVDWARRNRKQ